MPRINHPKPQKTMKKIVLFLVMFVAIFSANAQTRYVKYEFMKVLPGQDYEKLEQSWINYHKEMMKADIITLHRIWKVLPGSDADYDYVVTTVFNNYQDALGLGKSVSLDDFKAKYPEDYQVMWNNTLKTRTMVRDAIMTHELGLGADGYTVTPQSTLMTMVFIKSKNEKYEASEIAFSNKWHNMLINNDNKMAFNFMQRIGEQGTESRFSHLITHLYKNIDQMNKKVDMTKFKMNAAETSNYNQLLTYRDITKTVLHINVMNLEK
jgi:hypothetical protein